MAISGGILWVSDITTLRTFDAESGKPIKDYPVKGATFLNDLAPAAEAGVYVSDSGLKQGFESSGSDAVLLVSAKGKVTTVAKGADLGRPNGLYAPGDGSVWVVTFGSGELYQLGADGKKSNVTKLPKGQLDGIVPAEGGDLLISSWEASAIFRGKPGGEWKEVVSNVKSPADIGWDSKRKRVLVPLFQVGDIELHALP
jgi:sugar lactone lactonase YvrE